MAGLLRSRLQRCTVYQRNYFPLHGGSGIREFHAHGIRRHLDFQLVCCRFGAVRLNSSDAVAHVQPTRNTEDRWWQIWKWQRTRVVIRLARVAFLSLALFQWGRQSGMQEYAKDPRGERQKLIEEIVSSRGVQKVKDKSSREAESVQRVLSRILPAALEDTKCRQDELKEKLATKGEDKELHVQLEEIKRSRRLLKMWPKDGFIVLDTHSPNAFVTPSVPGLIFVHSGLFNTEHAVPVEDFNKLELNAPLYGRFKEGATYYMPEQRKWVEFKQSTVLPCEFVSNKKIDETMDCVVKVQWTKTKAMEICIPQEDIKKHWTYSVIESDAQLAMILGHEISHAIHGHGEDTVWLNAILLGLQLMLLAVLDTTGLASMLTVLGIPVAMKYTIELPFSRHQEFEADATGLRIVARAGYKVHDAAGFFERLDTYSLAFGGGSHRNWNSTHPKSEDRTKTLYELETEVMKYYDASKVPVEKAPTASPHDRRSFLQGVAATFAVIGFAGILANCT